MLLIEKIPLSVYALVLAAFARITNALICPSDQAEHFELTTLPNNDSTVRICNLFALDREKWLITSRGCLESYLPRRDDDRNVLWTQNENLFYLPDQISFIRDDLPETESSEASQPVLVQLKTREPENASLKPICLPQSISNEQGQELERELFESQLDSQAFHQADSHLLMTLDQCKSQLNSLKQKNLSSALTEHENFCTRSRTASPHQTAFYQSNSDGRVELLSLDSKQFLDKSRNGVAVHANLKSLRIMQWIWEQIKSERSNSSIEQCGRKILFDTNLTFYLKNPKLSESIKVIPIGRRWMIGITFDFKKFATNFMNLQEILLEINDKVTPPKHSAIDKIFDCRLETTAPHTQNHHLFLALTEKTSFSEFEPVCPPGSTLFDKWQLWPLGTVLNSTEESFAELEVFKSSPIECDHIYRGPSYDNSKFFAEQAIACAVVSFFKSKDGSNSTYDHCGLVRLNKQGQYELRGFVSRSLFPIWPSIFTRIDNHTSRWINELTVE